MRIKPLFDISVTYVKDGDPVWVEVAGGEGWEDWSLAGQKDTEDVGGYGSVEDALSAIQWAKGQAEPKPKK